MTYYIEKLKALAGSRRFKAAVAAIMVVVLHEGIGLDESAANMIAGILVAWILGDSINPTSSPRLRDMGLGK